jgi:hypothetical protein
MDKNFLDKVVNQIVSETNIDHDKEEINFPFPIRFPFFLPLSFFFFTSDLFFSNFSEYTFFIKHCEEIYGLNKKEIRYVRVEYKEIIINKVNNG